MDSTTRKHLNLLIQLAEADKHFAKIERNMIFKIAKERSFPDEMVQDLIRNPEPIDSLETLSPNKKFDYLLSCIELIFADQKVFESEIIFCKNIAIKLGFKKGVIDYFVSNYSKKSPEELQHVAISEYL